MGIRRKEAASLLFSTVSSFFSCGKCEEEEEEAVGKCLPEGDLAARRRYRLPPPTKPGPQPIAEEKEEESGVTFLAILSGSGKTDVIAVTETLALEYRVSFELKASMRLQKKIACLLAVSCVVMQRAAEKNKNCVHFPPDFLPVHLRADPPTYTIITVHYTRADFPTHFRLVRYGYEFAYAVPQRCRKIRSTSPPPYFVVLIPWRAAGGKLWCVCVFVPLFSLGGHTTPLPSQVSQGKLGNSSFLPFSLFPAEKKGGGSNLAALLHTATEATPGTGFDKFRQGLQQKISPIPMKCCVSL